MTREVSAHLKFLRQSPRKVRLVADMIRGRSAVRAVSILSVLSKRPAKPLLKLLQSAMANAGHNFSLDTATLKISRLTVDGGPALKRWMPKAHGRATPVREPTAHITMVLSGEKAEEKVEPTTKKKE